VVEINNLSWDRVSELVELQTSRSSEGMTSHMNEASCHQGVTSTSTMSEKTVLTLKLRAGRG
jgi:hypothetical protein